MAAAIAPPAQADFAAGLAAYEAGDFAGAFRNWRPLAEKGDTAAMRNLGHLYRWGRGVDKNPAEAVRWYYRAADLGLDRAQANLASLYLNGEGVERDQAEAAYWFQRAALQGHVVAQYNLGLMYEHGMGVEKNSDRAIGFYSLAAKAGHPQSQDRLQEIHANQIEAAPLSVQTAEAKAADNVPADAQPPTAMIDAMTDMVVAAAPQAETAAPSAVSGLSPRGAMASLVPVPRWDALPARTIDPPARKLLASLVRSEQKSATAPAPRAGIKNTGFDIAALIAPAPTKSSRPGNTGSAEAARAAQTSDDIESGKLDVARKAKDSDARRANPNAVAAAATTAKKLDPAMVADRIARGQAAHRVNDYATALSLWLPLAYAGQAKAQVLAGKMYQSGLGVPVDKVRAAMWWILAARQGNAEAKAVLADQGPALSPDQIVKARTLADEFRVQS